MLEELDPKLAEALRRALEIGPQVALFGQHAMGANAPNNPFISAAKAKYGKAIHEWWLESEATLRERAADVNALCAAVVVPESCQTVLRWPWSTVFTSSVDSVLTRALEIPDRRLVNQITGTDFSARAATTSLRLVRLFGTVDRDDIGDLPPNDARDLRTRRAVSLDLLGKVASLVSSNGTLFIDGWLPERDWLRVRDLAPAITPLARGQIFVFGVTPETRTTLESDPDFRELIDDGTVSIVSLPLDSVFQALIDADCLPERPDSHVGPGYIVYEVLSARHPKPIDVQLGRADLAAVNFEFLEWRRLSDGLVVLHELAAAEPLSLDPQEGYRQFRQLGAHGPTPQNLRWVLELAYRRPVVDNLLAACQEIVANKAPQETLLILRGQSGSGKTIALAQLAVELRCRGFAVLYVPPTFLRVARHKVDEFCERISEKSESPVFLLYDGTQDVSEYFDLAEYFASRARKCVVVGTAFTFQGDNDGHSRPYRRKKDAGVVERFIDIDVTLDPDEQENLLAHLATFLEPASIDLRTLLKIGADHFFAMIYRALPVARGPLEEGFLRECAEGARRIEERVATLADDDAAEHRPMTAIEQALREAREALGDRLDNLLLGGSIGHADDTHSTAEGRPSEKVRALLDAVMLVSRYHLQLPQTIALRMLSHDIRAYRGAFTGGLLDERELAPGVYVLSARHPLEAEIWTRRHLPAREEQWSAVESICGHLRSSEVINDYGTEMEFLVALFHAIGPQGPKQWRWPPGFLRLAELVGNLREIHGELSPRLQLIESHALREWIHYEQRNPWGADNSIDLHGFLQRLDSAEEGLRSAYDLVHDRSDGRVNRGARRLLATLETERACVVGTKVGSLVRSAPYEDMLRVSSQQRLNSWWAAARDAWRAAHRWNDSNRMGFDAACWICDERAKAGFLDDRVKAEVVAEWNDALERYAALDLSIEQETKRDGRSADFHRYVGNEPEFQAIVERLATSAAPSAQALYSRYLCAEQGAQAACKYLEVACGDGLYSEPLLLYPYLRFWWQVHTGLDSFFPQERLALGLSVADWEHLRRICRAFREYEPENSVAMYLEAVAGVHVSDAAVAATILRSLDHLGTGGALRSKSLILYSDEAGSPVKLSATYKGHRRGSTHLAWCDRIAQNVAFSPIEFGNSDIRPGAMIEPFHLAVGFRGLWADPVRLYARTHGR